jgi:prepilin-type N-terminal cleavage/methylation domain-containing protein
MAKAVEEARMATSSASRRATGFTLIELMVVVLLIGLALGLGLTLDVADSPQHQQQQALVFAAELNLINGITPALVAALTPHVSVWGNGKLNLNTLDHHLLWSARAEAGISAAEPSPLMLRILNNAASLLPLRSEAATLLAAARSANGGVLQNLELFRSGPLVAQNWELDGLALTSDFFLLTADMQMQARHYQLQSVLQRAVTPAGVPVVTVRTRQYGSALFNLDDHCAAALP